MSDLANLYSDLKEVVWFKIPSSDFLIKFLFSEDGYSILVTNLKEIFGEITNENEVQRRFSNLNIHAEMKTNVIMRNLKKTLVNALEGNCPSLKLHCFEKSMRIQAHFNVSLVAFVFNIQLQLLTSCQLRSHILMPTLSHALLTYQENIALKKRLSLLENKLKVESSPQDCLPDYKKNLNAFCLMKDKNVSETVLIDSFLTAQKDMQECLNERRKVIELQEACEAHPSNLLPSRIKKEKSEPCTPVKFEDRVENMDQVTETSCNSLQFPVKREISDSSTLTQNDDQEENDKVSNITTSVSNPQKMKKKKYLKF